MLVTAAEEGLRVTNRENHIEALRRKLREQEARLIRLREEQEQGSEGPHGHKYKVAKIAMAEREWLQTRVHLARTEGTISKAKGRRLLAQRGREKKKQRRARDDMPEVIGRELAGLKM